LICILDRHRQRIEKDYEKILQNSLAKRNKNFNEANNQTRSKLINRLGMPDEVSQSELLPDSNRADHLSMTNVEGTMNDARSPKEVGRSTLNVGFNNTMVEEEEENLCNVSGYFRTKEDRE
jgi:hypothetical protein